MNGDPVSLPEDQYVKRDLAEHLRQQNQLVHVTNFGYAYCIEHGADQPGALGEKRGTPHRVVETVCAGDAAGYCDWPGCNMKFSGHPSKPAECLCTYLHDGAMVITFERCPKHGSRRKQGTPQT